MAAQFTPLIELTPVSVDVRRDTVFVDAVWRVPLTPKVVVYIDEQARLPPLKKPDTFR